MTNRTGKPAKTAAHEPLPGPLCQLLSSLSPLLFLFLFLLILPSSLSASDREASDTGAYELHSQTWSLGASLGRVEGLSGDLARLAGSDDGVITLEFSQNDYLTPYTSQEFQVTLNLLENITLLQGACGYRWSTVPFPKAFLRPWVGGYLTFNLLEDERDPALGNHEFEGVGVGVAAALGMTIKFSAPLALEAALKGDRIVTLGRLESGDFFQDEFRIRGAYLRFIYLF